jgi:DNA-binding NtrC family response regulator
MSKPSVHALVVDDEPSVRLLISILLQRMGMKVTRCAEGYEALAKLAFQEHDLLVTDFHMPGIQGDQIIWAAQAHRADFPSVLVSAQPDIEAIRELLTLKNFRFLAKPFGVGEFQAVVGALMVDVLPRSGRC